VVHRIVNRIINPKVFLPLFLLAICFGIYGNTLHHGFLYDDTHLILNNNYIKHPQLWTRIFLVDFFHFAPLDPLTYYRPVPILTHALEYMLWQVNPWGYHLTNILLHFLNSYLIFYLIRLVFANIPLAILSSVFFCVHPIHSTTVSLLFNRGDLLLFLFILTSIIQYLKFEQSSKITHYLVSIFCFSFALLTKENAVFFFPLLYLCLYSAGLVKEKRRLFYIAVFFAVYMVYLYLRLAVLKIPFPQYDTHSVYHLDFILTLSNFLNIAMNYIGLLILPLKLYYHHGIIPIMKLSSQVILPFIFLIPAIMLFLWSLKKKKSILFFALFWGGLSISHVLKSMYTYSFFRLAMMEHWLYMPSIGFFLILGVLFVRLCRRTPKLSVLLALCVFTFWSALSIRYSNFGKDPGTFYRHILRNSPVDADAWFNLANELLELRNYSEARRHFKAALAHDLHAPNTPDIYLGLGNTYLREGNNSEAERHYLVALKYHPRFSEDWNNLGLVYKKQGKQQEAYAAFRRALDYNSESALACVNLGDLYAERGDAPSALGLYRKAFYLDPADAMFTARLVKAYLAMNDIKQAEDIIAKI